ncbi:MAG: 3-dehydroquinate synthase [Bacteroidales bacterium]|nr:3-dehydroquinate synthase [Bacteroidales bacterium]
MNQPTIIQTPEYPILLDVNAGQSLDAFLNTKAYSKLFVLMDENTYAHCYPLLAADSEILLEAELLVIDAGEENKSIAIAAQLWESLTEADADRHTLLINLGGGIVSDLGGFVASTFKRGMDFVNIPTTLLAMVDASIGGKTGVNLGRFKNQIGVFSSPKHLIIDVRFLETLAQEQIVSAFAEMIKHGLIADQNYYEELAAIPHLDLKTLTPHIEKSIRIKKQFVDQDPNEKGLRKALNFGHSIGHALESFFMETQNPLLHGEAVALGMIAEAYLSNKLLEMPIHQLKSIQELIKTHFKHQRIKADQIEAIAELVFHDKKKEGKKLNFSLLNQIGSCKINIQVSKKEIENALKYIVYELSN